jgi:hypothetical protein
MSSVAFTSMYKRENVTLALDFMVKKGIISIHNQIMPEGKHLAFLFPRKKNFPFILHFLPSFFQQQQNRYRSWKCKSDNNGLVGNY